MLRSALACLVTVLAALAPAAIADTQSAASGTVAATLSYDHAPESLTYENLLLTITRDGTQALSGDPSFGDCQSPYCAPGGFTDRGSVFVRDLDADGEPEVVVDLFTGGAHCCFVSRFYRWDGTTYVSSDRNFGDPGYKLADLDADGVQELITADYRFGYAFSAFAYSLMPVRIYDLRAGSWSLVTKRFPQRIRSDAAAAWKVFRKAGRQGEPRGAIAAWAADELMLGRRVSATRTLRRLASHGRLPGDFPHSQPKFVRNLLRFLARRGY
jgi:hypothetical protein